MNGVIGKLVLVVLVIGGIAWGFSAMVGQVREDVAGMKRQADALVMATDSDQAEREGLELARR